LGAGIDTKGNFDVYRSGRTAVSRLALAARRSAPNFIFRALLKYSGKIKRREGWISETYRQEACGGTDFIRH